MTRWQRLSKPGVACLLALSAVAAANERAHDPSHAPSHAAYVATEYGHPGRGNQVTRSVTIRMDDAMRFVPAELSFLQGQTVRLHVVNAGGLPHEFVLGTTQSIAEHAQMMRRMPDMDHHEPGAMRLAPGKSADLVWQFDRAGEFVYACLIPGHREAGMHGKVVVEHTTKR